MPRPMLSLSLASRQLKAPKGDFPPKRRPCTDVLFLLLLVANWGVMTLLGAIVLLGIANMVQRGRVR